MPTFVMSGPSPEWSYQQRTKLRDINSTAQLRFTHFTLSTLDTDRSLPFKGGFSLNPGQKPSDNWILEQLSRRLKFQSAYIHVWKKKCRIFVNRRFYTIYIHTMQRTALSPRTYIYRAQGGDRRMDPFHSVFELFLIILGKSDEKEPF